MPEILSLNTIFSLRQNRILGVEVWYFKGEEGNLPGDEKADVW